MLRSGRPFALAAAAALACAAPVTAQLRGSAFSVGGRVLAARPVGDRGEGLDAGRGFGFDVGYEARPGLAVYAGFSRTVFHVETAVGGADRVDSGADVGVLTTRSLGGVPLWFRGGLVLHEAETHLASGEGDGQDDGRSGIGLESGIGVALRLGRHLALLPGVAYTAYPVGDPGGISHLRAEVGLRLRP
jgi:hypothetical protein